MIGPAHYIPSKPGHGKAWILGILLGLAYVGIASCGPEAHYVGPPIDNPTYTIGGYLAPTK